MKEYLTLEEALFPDEKKRGGKRAGAGRKKKHYEPRVAAHCYKSHLPLVKSFISMVESSDDLLRIQKWIEENTLK